MECIEVKRRLVESPSLSEERLGKASELRSGQIFGGGGGCAL